ncbi:MAG: hypothetical protein OXN20_07380 [Gemmatimonadota bacterium]|nr:hypothetical protein [Gemmatimonadota bacterium]
MPDDPKVKQSKLLIVEGNDEIRVFKSLSKYLNIQDLEVRHYGGNSKLRQFLKTFSSLSEFGLFRSLAVVADANSNRAGREQQIRDALSNASLPVPSRPLEVVSNGDLKVAYLVVPHNVEGTMIEDVCLDSVKTDPAIECVDLYFECVSQADIPGPREVWMSKARVHAFLASRDRPDLRLGEAVEKGIWEFDTDAFLPLKELLRIL